tara:strand:+ start:1781 stop:1975 length:195 start_codon:yes stop_codon:yes gene_type:complete
MTTYNDIFRSALDGDGPSLKSAVDNALVDKIRDSLVNRTLDVSKNLLNTQDDAEEIDTNSAETE